MFIFIYSKDICMTWSSVLLLSKSLLEAAFFFCFVRKTQAGDSKDEHSLLKWLGASCTVQTFTKTKPPLLREYAIISLKWNWWKGPDGYWTRTHEQEGADGLKFHASMRLHSSYLIFVKEKTGKNRIFHCLLTWTIFFSA